jgi:hypothetical protein
MATAVQTVEVPVDVQTETLATDEHTAKVRIIQISILLEHLLFHEDLTV